MNVRWEQKDGTTVARIEGRIDSANILVFQRALESSLDPDARNVVVDFEKVVFMSSAGLRVVLVLGKQLRKRGAKLAVCSLSAPIREIFAVSNFDRILPTHSSETQAIDALAGDQEPDAGKAGRLRNTIDFDIVGDNLRDIASFTVEKYEYINNCTLSDEMREKVMEGINDALWQRVQQLKRERLRILKDMFIAASNALDDVVTTPAD